MSTSKRTAFRLACAATGAVALVALSAGTSLASTPPYQPGTSSGGDPNNVGTLSFYNAAGAQVYSGSTNSPVAPFIKTSGLTPLTGNTKAGMFYADPQPGVNPGNWNQSAASGSTSFPVNSAAAPIKYFTDPVVTTKTTGTAPDETLNQGFTQYPYDTNAADTGYYDMYEIRVYDTGTSGPDQNYAAADILINPANGTWSQVYPNATTTSETVTPPTTATPGSPVVLSSVTSPATDGSIQFYDGKTAIGSPQAVTSSNGAATVTTSALAAGAHNLYAAFTPTAVTDGPSTSASNAFTVAAAASVALPEAPYALLLPLIGLTAVGALVVRRRARA